MRLDLIRITISRTSDTVTVTELPNRYDIPDSGIAAAMAGTATLADAREKCEKWRHKDERATEQ